MLDVSIARKSYHKIDFTGRGNHPYFSRSWHCHHLLDERPPLLEESIKNYIRNSGGVWPYEELA